MKAFFLNLWDIVCVFFFKLTVKVIVWMRDVSGINADMQTVAQDFTRMVDHHDTLNKTVFDIFQALPFTAGILSLKASDAAKLVNPTVMVQNELVPLLTSIVLSARQGDSSLQVGGDITPAVREELRRRGFKVEDVTGSKDNKGTFILWT